MSAKTIDLRSVLKYQDVDTLARDVLSGKEFKTRYTDIFVAALRTKDSKTQAHIFRALQKSMSVEELQKTADALDFYGYKYDTIETPVPTDQNGLERTHEKENNIKQDLEKGKQKSFIEVWAGYFIKIKDRIFMPKVKVSKDDFMRKEFLARLEEEEAKRKAKEKVRREEEDKRRKMLIELWEEEAEKRKKATKTIKKKEHPKHFRFFEDNTRQ